VARKLTDPLSFAATVLVVIAAFLGLDAGASAYEQLVIGAATWALLFAACKPLSPEERGRVALVVLVATAAEVMGSIVLGAYTYRLENLPAFVPPGHGLVYLAGLQISRSGPVRRHARALAAAGLVYMLVRGGAPTLYAGVFVIVAFLELYGTSIGAWHWAETIPGTPVGAGNPPSGIASIYVLFDIAAIALAPRLLASLSSVRRLPSLARLATSS
jgi:hypothetical protein